MFNQKVTTQVTTKRANILSMFTKTLEDLKALNVMALGQIEVEQKTVADANAEIVELEEVVASNNKTIEQIDKFLA